MTSMKPISKMRRLPNTDLARIATLDEQSQRTALVRFCYPAPNLKSYRPVRLVQAEIFKASMPLMEAPDVKWETLEAIIRRRSKDIDQEEMNVRAGKALFNGLRALNTRSREDSLIRTSIGFSGQRRFDGWLPYLVECDLSSDLLIPQVDFRSNAGLVKRTFKFVFSMMNLAIRENAPEFEQASFAILRLPFRKKSGDEVPGRYLSCTLDDRSYFEFEELQDMISTTYRLYDEVLVEEQRRAA